MNRLKCIGFYTLNNACTDCRVQGHVHGSVLVQDIVHGTVLVHSVVYRILCTDQCLYRVVKPNDLGLGLGCGVQGLVGGKVLVQTVGTETCTLVRPARCD